MLRMCIHLTALQPVQSTSMSPTPPPPPPYSPTGTRAQVALAPQFEGPMLSATAVPTTNWTRRFECQTDTSFICLNLDGSWVYYSQGDGKAAAKPTLGRVSRKYFCSNTSSITLNGEGWIEYNDGAGNINTMSAAALCWHAYAGHPGWYANTPRTEPVPNMSNALVPRVRPDSGYAAYIVQNTPPPRRSHERRPKYGDDEDSDGHNDMYKFGVVS